MEEPEQFDFDLDIKTKRVTIKKERYVLTEALEGGYCAWRNAQFRNAKMDDDGKVTIGSMADCEPVLIGQSLFKVPEGAEWAYVEGMRPVGEEFIRGQPTRVTKPLYDWVIRNSDLKSRSKSGDAEDKGPKD